MRSTRVARGTRLKHVMRAASRVALAIVIAVVASVVIAIVFLHTSYGREVVRAQLEKHLKGVFTGKATIGKLEGSVFTTLVLRDFALDDADGHPALRIEELSVHLALLPLLSHEVRIDHLVADGVFVNVEKDDRGELELGKLMQQTQRSEWDVELPDLQIKHAHLAGAFGNADGIELRGTFSHPLGKPLRASVVAYGTWRAKAMPILAAVMLRQEPDKALYLPSLLVTAGGALVSGVGVAIRERTGMVFADAPRQALARFGLAIPDDVRLAATVRDGLFVDAIGTLGASPLQLIARGDVEARRARGVAIVGGPRGLALPQGRVGGVVTFEVTQGDPELLPVGVVVATGWTELDKTPPTHVLLAAASDGTKANVALDGATDGARVLLGAQLHRVAERVTLDDARILAWSSGIANLRGAMHASLAVRGELSPQRDLAITGAIDGANLRTQGMAAQRLHAAIDARHLPAAPAGRASVTIAGLSRGAMQLGALALSARSRADGRIAVVVDSRSPTGWLVQAEALVTPGQTVEIAFGHHEVRVGGGASWTGDGGLLAISPATVVLSHLHTASTLGEAALDASYARATRALSVTAKASSPMVASLDASVGLTVPKHAREVQAWRSAITRASIRATGIAAEPEVLATFGIASKLGASVDLSLEVAAGARSGKLSAQVHHLHGPPLVRPLDLRIDATTDLRSTHATIAIRGPASVNLGDLDVTIPRAAERITRDAPLSGTFQLTTLPAPMLASMFGRDQLTGGTLDGVGRLGGTLGKPTLHADLGATHLAFATAGSRGRSHELSGLDHLGLTADWDGERATASLDGHEPAGGTLHLTATSKPGQLADADFTLDAKRFDLAPFGVFFTGQAAGATGRIEGALQLHGIDPHLAKLSGELHLVDGRIPLTPNLGMLHEVTLDLAIASDRAKIAVAAKLGDGTVIGGGTIDLAANAPTGSAIHLAIRKATLVGVLQPAIDADITAKLHHDGRHWIADAIVDHGAVSVPRRSAKKLLVPGGPPEMIFVDGTHTKPIADNPSVPHDPLFVANVTIHATRVVDDGVKGVIAGQLQISTDGKSFGVLGELGTARGDVDLFGRRYNVERATIRYDGTTDPLLDIQLSHDYTEFTTTANIRGRMSRPEVTMRTDTGIFTQGQLLGFLLGDDPAGDPRDAASRDRATSSGESLLANELGVYLRQPLPGGINVLRYEVGSATNSAAATIGGWVTQAFFVGYRRHLEPRPDENVHESALEYWLGRRVSVEGTVGDRGYDGIDLLWRKRY